MTSQSLPTPPSTPQPAPTSEASPMAANPSLSQTDLLPSIHHLDALLETYLHLLHQYTTLRTQLSQKFSDGFFALARANHTSSGLGAGRRYGAEGYDERMKASNRVVVEWRGGRIEKVKGGMVDTQAEEKEEDEKKDTKRAEVAQAADEKSIEVPELDSGDIECYEFQVCNINPPIPADLTSSTHSATSKSCQPPRTSSIDPLKWYTLLPPPALRAAQSHFRTSLSTSIAPLLTTTSQLQSLEDKIRTVRTALGLENGVEEGDEVVVLTEDGDKGDGKESFRDVSSPDAEVKVGEDGKDMETMSANCTASSRSKQRLVHRAVISKPRPPVLKVD